LVGKGKGQQVACVAKQIKSFANNGQGSGVQSTGQTGSRELLFNYDDYRLLGEYDTSGDVIQETVWLESLPVATVQNGSVYYIHTDHLGTPRVISDYDNVEVWKWESDPFGVAAANEDLDGDGQSFTYHLRFPGQYYDSETGKHYNYFRDYDSKTGRYVESDPVGLNGGLNTYSYVENNPVYLIDPYGLASSVIPVQDVAGSIYDAGYDGYAHGVQARNDAVVFRILCHFFKLEQKEIKTTGHPL
jgi:RHS repeat-associated protein